MRRTARLARDRLGDGDGREGPRRAAGRRTTNDLGLAAAAAAGGWFVGGAGLACLAATLPPVVLASTRRLAHDRARRVREAALVGALERLVAALRAGANLHEAVRLAGRDGPEPIAGELRAVAEAAEVRGLVAALDAWPGDGDRLVAPAASALALAAELGGPGARALDGLVASLRERRAAAGEASALASQARLSAGVLALAPIGFALVAGALDARSAGFLLRTGAGQLCLAVGLGLDAVGAAWMARVTGERAA